MEKILPLDPFTLEPVDEPYRGRQDGVRGHALAPEAISHPMAEILHVIEYFGLTPNGSDLEQLRKAIQAAVSGAGGNTLTREQVEDFVGALISGLGASYDDANNVLNIDVPIANLLETLAGVNETKAINSKNAALTYVAQTYAQNGMTFHPFPKGGEGQELGIITSGAIEVAWPNVNSNEPHYFSMDIEIVTARAPYRANLYTLTGLFSNGNLFHETVKVDALLDDLSVRMNYDSVSDRYYFYFGDLDSEHYTPIITVTNLRMWAGGQDNPEWLSEGFSISEVGAFKGDNKFLRNPPAISSGGSALPDVTGAIGTTSFVASGNAPSASTLSDLEGVTPSTWTRIFSQRTDDTTNGTANTHINVYRRTA